MLDEENRDHEEDVTTEEIDENPLLSILEPDGEEDELDETTDNPETDSLDVLKDRIHARNQTIKQRERAIERLRRENEELKLRSAQPRQQEAPPGSDDRDPVKELEALRQKFEDDPSSIVEVMLERERQLEEKVASVLSRRDQFLKAQLAPKPPEDEARIMEALKKRPEYQGWQDDQLRVVAQTLKVAGSKVTQRRPPAPASGNVKPDASLETLEKVYADELKAMGY